LLQYGDKSLGIEASAEAGNDLDVGFAIVGLLLCCVCCVQVRLLRVPWRFRLGYASPSGKPGNRKISSGLAWLLLSFGVCLFSKGEGRCIRQVRIVRDTQQNRFDPQQSIYVNQLAGGAVEA